MIHLIIAACHLLVVGAFLDSTCNFESHHTHLFVPLGANSEAECESNNRWLAFHGSTFFCPHMMHIRLHGSLAPLDAVQSMCRAYFAAPIHRQWIALRPTLPIDGLPMSAFGLSKSWVSPIAYAVHAFGDSFKSGPGAGWNTTTIYNSNVTFAFEPLYYYYFGLSDKTESSLSYHLLNVDGQLFLSHVLSSAPDFEAIMPVVKASIVPEANAWPLLVRFPGVPDLMEHRLESSTTVQGKVVSSVNGITTMLDIQITTGQEYYSSVDDGFVDFGVNCPQVDKSYPRAPRLCPK